jgi:putative sterol carrier protein
MGVKFLSEEWTQQTADALNSHESFATAVANLELTMQFTVTDTPANSDIQYYVAVSNGAASVALGTIDDPDVGVSNDYSTAAAVSKGELNMQSAFMTGKLKVSGNLAKLMMHQSALTHLAAAVSDMDVEY